MHVLDECQNVTPRRAAWAVRSRRSQAAVERQCDGQPGQDVADPEQGRQAERLEARQSKDGRDRQALNDGLELAGRPGPEGWPWPSRWLRRPWIKSSRTTIAVTIQGRTPVPGIVAR